MESVGLSVVQGIFLDILHQEVQRVHVCLDVLTCMMPVHHGHLLDFAPTATISILLLAGWQLIAKLLVDFVKAKPDDHVNLTTPTNPDDYCEDYWTIKFLIIPCKFD